MGVVDGDHDGGGVYDERDYTFDAEAGHFTPRRRPRASGWKLFGQVVAALLCCFGLVVVGFIVFVLMALNSWGSNK